ncbi:LysR family transcriptional regulator [Sandaracinus amylolyticus]|uniref:LysR family transcriptional regulator n=1 Tax=Sandaracinus amylolyticus TaxID=927083 RepID=UPI00069F6EDF|nr:LysR family transcriptional regulator [Sandaracinus amylolyticus]
MLERPIERHDDDTLFAMSILVRALAEGSLAAAARSLHLTPSAVSKRLARLEQQLGVPLVRRTTRSLAPTPAGARYAEHAERILAEVDRAAREARGEHREIRGLLRVSAPTLLGQELLAPHLATLLERHPALSIDLVLADRYVDLVAERVDVAIRIAPSLRSSGLVARKLGVYEPVLVASPRWLASVAPIREPRDLESRRCLDLAHSLDRGRWTLTVAGRAQVVRPQIALLSTHLGALHRAALAGAGVAALPVYLVAHDLERGALERVLPRASLPRRTVHVVHASGRAAPAKVRAFVDLVIEALGPALVPAHPRARAR